jgi:hypothetical protein
LRIIKENAMKFMNANRLIVLILSLAAISLIGCRHKTEPPPPSTLITGVASAGPVNFGLVTAYAIRSGVVDTATPLGQEPTDPNGNFAVNVGTYEGPVMLRVTGGSFTDEASGVLASLKIPLRALISNATATGSNVAAVTPLTELAVVKSESAGNITAQAIDDTNAEIASFFNLNDIITTLPIAAGTGDEKKYVVFLAIFSQFVNNNKNQNETLDDALTRLLAKISDDMGIEGGVSIATITGLNTAKSDFDNSGKNGTGVTIDPLPIPTTAALNLSLSSAGTTTTIGAVDVTVDLPDGITVVADAVSGETGTGVVTITGEAGKNGSSFAKFTAASTGTPAKLHITLINTNGFGPGDFAMIMVDRDPGGSFPTDPAAFSVSSATVEGLSGPFLSGVTASSSFVGVELK